MRPPDDGVRVFRDGYSAALCEWCNYVTEALYDKVSKCMACGRPLADHRTKRPSFTVTGVDVARGVITVGETK